MVEFKVVEKNKKQKHTKVNKTYSNSNTVRRER